MILDLYPEKLKTKKEIAVRLEVQTIEEPPDPVPNIC